MTVEKRCSVIERDHGAHFWRLDGTRVKIQPAPGVLFCPGHTGVERFDDPLIAEQLTFPAAL